MYHIFLIIAAIASQDQVANVKQQFQQQKDAYIRSTHKNSDDDIILQLKKQSDAEEKAIKPDLESLGLDPVDVVASSKKTTPEPQPEVKKDPAVKITSVAEVNLPDITKNLPKDLPKKVEEQPKSVKEEPKSLPPLPEPLDKSQKEDKTKTDVTALEQVEKIEKVENQNDKKTLGDKLTSVTERSIEKIKGVFDKKQPEEKDKVLPPEKEVVQPIVKANTESDDKIAQEKKEQAKKRREERIAQRKILADLKQQKRTAKLEELRQKYLQQNEEDVYEGISHYQTMSKIIPQKKIPPKFLTNEVPAQLLNRFRGPDNRHHPVIMSNSEKIDFMFKAIAENRIDDFNSIFNLLQNPNIKNSFGDTLLTFAILMRRYDAVSSLISKGANPDLANDLGYTPLNIAIEMADYRSVEILINIGAAKTNFVDELGRTYLMQSVRVGSLPITDLLISNGIDINAADNNEVTALAIAYKHKKDIIAKYLLKYGAKSWVKKDYIDDDNSMVEELFNKWK